MFVENFNSYFLVNDQEIYLDLWMFVFFSTGIVCLIKALKSLQALNQFQKAKELTFFTYAYLGVLIFFSITYLVLRKNYNWTFELILMGLIEVFVFVLLYRVFKFSNTKSVLGIKSYPNSIHLELDFEELATKLEQVMTEKQPYLDKKLTLVKLSDLSDISANKLSQVFSVHYQSSFYQFVNSYRINHLQLLLEDSQYEKFTISAMAEMSGFNSKATFYKVFREKHGVSPSEYVNNMSP
ncbi:MAG: helix-turn-helix transcriptional regulator [Bacteroidota bacterium]